MDCEVSIDKKTNRVYYSERPFYSSPVTEAARVNSEYTLKADRSLDDLPSRADARETKERNDCCRMSGVFQERHPDPGTLILSLASEYVNTNLILSDIAASDDTSRPLLGLGVVII
jgi:hypothetical protein